MEPWGNDPYVDRKGPYPDQVRVRLLGPVEVSVHGRPVVLGGPRLRALFGLLALRAPAVVSRDALIDGIWGEQPPGAAAGTLRAHIAYLRRCLNRAGAKGVIVTRAPGYLLAVPTETVDVNRFEASLERGRRAALAGGYEMAVRCLRGGLRRWRGELLADCVTGTWVNAERVRLDQLRLHAVEELLAARLAVGQPALVAAELTGLVQHHPLRERMWELLMLALHGSGRPAEALHAYQRARALLWEELAVEPGRRLRQLEQAIRFGDDPMTMDPDRPAWLLTAAR